jgi:major membrane immunogen (membrane-anchored lipoprotein)
MTTMISSVLALLLFASCASKDSTPGTPANADFKPTADNTKDNAATEDVERTRGEREVVAEQKTRNDYHASVTARLAKLDTAMAATKDVPADLRTRRNSVESRIAQMPATADASWAAYTKDLDAEFATLERDLRPQ